MWPPRGDHTSPPAGSWSDRRRALGLLENTGGWTGYREPIAIHPSGWWRGWESRAAWTALAAAPSRPPSAGLGHWRLLAASPDP